MYKINLALAIVGISLSVIMQCITTDELLKEAVKRGKVKTVKLLLEKKERRKKERR